MKSDLVCSHAYKIFFAFLDSQCILYDNLFILFQTKIAL